VPVRLAFTARDGFVKSVLLSDNAGGPGGGSAAGASAGAEAILLALQDDGRNGWLVMMQWLVDGVFMMYMCANFRTALVRRGVLTTDGCEIALAYLNPARGWCTIDKGVISVHAAPLSKFV
jgi:hypothetical protein